MDLVSCKKCKRLVVPDGLGVIKCSSCGYQAEDKLGKLREYLLEHPCASIQEVHHKTGVSISTIRDYVNHGDIHTVKKMF
ncbi:MAG: hypothetical protein ATN36_00905 [Epulopiscium sp. Nele67-Bin005]|nr:MAG: hypothetical protein ATN36_00905 [Epulopiscium sp. Nele67-Bin005]